MSKRTQQIESLLQRTIAQVLQRDMADPRIEGGMVSITHVHVSPDLHEAEVYVSVLPEDRQKRVAAGLRHAAGHIHKLVRKRVAMRTVPHLDFRLDETLKKQAKVFEAIQQGVRRSGPAQPTDEPPPPPPPPVSEEEESP